LESGGDSVKIAISGSRGFIGSAVAKALGSAGHDVIPIVRAGSAVDGAIAWSAEAANVDTAKLDGLDAVIHLAGESIQGRWTPGKKARIRESRFKGTRLLAEALAHSAKPPGVFVCASAIGYYGNRGDQILREESGPGEGFLADVVREWEAATEPAAKKGIRVVNARTGIVLGSEGGALAQMLLPFKMGVGGRIGSGQQYMSWIALDDEVGAIQHALTSDRLRGPVNLVAPNPARNAEFTKVLGKVLSRPTIFPLPAFAVKLAFGQMGEELLLWSQRVEPERLASSGYKFRYPDLEGALRKAVGK
jgi:uncharacterized protein (TIGR01777 family)